MQQSVVTKSMNGVQLVKKLGQNLKVPSTKISSAELVKNSKLEETIINLWGTVSLPGQICK
jgi:hypothetical protein